MPSARAATCTSLVWDSEVGFPALIRNSDNSGARDQHPQRFQPFCPECGDNKTHARDIAAGTVETGDEAVPDEIGRGKNNWNRRACSLGRQCGRRAAGEDRGDMITDQISRKRRQAIILTIR